MTNNDILKSDVLIVGTGIAGCATAIKLAEKGISCLMIQKGKGSDNNNTSKAQGGIAVLGLEEEDVFVQDILESGDRLNHIPAVKYVVSKSKAVFKDILLDKCKVPFTKDDTGNYDLAMEGAHSTRRIYNVKDMTGKVIQEKMLEYINGLKNVKILEEHTAVDLITLPHNSKHNWRYFEPSRVVGAYVYDTQRDTVIRIFAKKVVLATGGLCSIFLHSTNPPSAVGNGMSMAYRAGARLANLEYEQFHPTSLFHRDAGSFLISEAVRGEGAKLMNKGGEYFMKRYSSLEDLAPRDETSRAIYEEMISRGDDYVLLDLASFAKVNIAERFPTIYQTCKNYGIDITKEPIPVVPAAHYSCGGIATNISGKSSLNNLYAVGEVAVTGVHGANRLASVSLLEALVFGESAAQDIASSNLLDNFDLDEEVLPWMSPKESEELDPALVHQDLIMIKHTMWNYSGIIRTTKRLERARADLNYLKHRIFKFYRTTKIKNKIIDLRDSVQIALLVVEAALKNKKSSGAHYIKESEKSLQDF